MQLKEASILVVDDEPVLLEILSAWVQRLAGHVFTAGNGAQALEVMAANKIDLIVTDIRMPVMDGISLLKKVKAGRSHTPSVILATGFSDIEAREAYDLGAEALLEKPMERDDLIGAIKRSLTEREDLWRTSLDLAAYPILTGRLEGLATALQEHRIAFGRGGLCIETEQFLVMGPVNIELDCKADQYVLSAQGVVRWLAYEENQVGIEFTYVAEQSRARVVQLTSNAVCFIPCTTGRNYQVRAGRS